MRAIPTWVHHLVPFFLGKASDRVSLTPMSTTKDGADHADHEEDQYAEHAETHHHIDDKLEYIRGCYYASPYQRYPYDDPQKHRKPLELRATAIHKLQGSIQYFLLVVHWALLPGGTLSLRWPELLLLLWFFGL